MSQLDTNENKMGVLPIPKLLLHDVSAYDALYACSGTL